jgi:trans-aconitate methyltransferase
MDRIPEAELMDDAAQALAYAQADFSAPHNHFIELFTERFGSDVTGTVLDLGCGPGDICRRFSNAFPNCLIHGVDGSSAMLELAESDNSAERLGSRIKYFLACLPDAGLPLRHYDVLISNSLLHHLNDPATLWDSITGLGRAGAVVFVMDLLRPENPQRARQLVEEYAGEEPAILQTDFFNSLLAAYRPEEVKSQLQQCQLSHLELEVVSDRHFIVFGHL